MAQFKDRMLEKFLLDATICAMRGANKENELPKPLLRGKVKIDTSRPILDRVIEQHFELKIAAPECIGRGIFKRAKKPQAIRVADKRHHIKLGSLFSEDSLFLTEEGIENPSSKAEAPSFARDQIPLQTCSFQGNFQDTSLKALVLDSDSKPSNSSASLWLDTMSLDG